MRTAGLAVICFLLAACGGSDVSGKIKSACMKDGDMTDAQCSCIADRAERDLSKDAQAMLVAEMEEDRARVEELGRQMSMQDAASVGTFVMNAMAQCAMGQEPAE